MPASSSSRPAAVAAGGEATAAAAADVLRAGGNAFDAVVAAGFAAAIAEPTLSSLGGGGFLMAAPAGEDPRVYDFFVDAPGRGLALDELEPHFLPITVRYPGAAQIFNVGWGSVAVPGCLDGYLHVHRAHGRLPLADVVAPAIELGRKGVVVDRPQASFAGLIADIVSLTPEGRALFAPGGRPLVEGDIFCNGRLADVLVDVAEGRIAGIAYWGDALEKVMLASGGLVTRADVEQYRIVQREPIALHYRGAELWTNPAPSYGGTLVTEALGTLGRGPRLDGSAEAYVRLAAALVTMSERKVADPHAVTGTTHVSVLDADGSVAAMTTSFGSTSGVFIPDTGIHLNNMMGEADLHPDGFHLTPPGVRVRSMMAPTVVREPDGSVTALGSGGSERIRSALTCVLTNLLDRHLPLTEAVLGPRTHWDREALQVEPGLANELTSAVGGHWPVNEWAATSLYFGGVHAVRRAGDGTVTAVGDPRRGGSGRVVTQP